MPSLRLLVGLIKFFCSYADCVLWCFAVSVFRFQGIDILTTGENKDLQTASPTNYEKFSQVIFASASFGYRISNCPMLHTVEYA